MAVNLGGLIFTFAFDRTIRGSFIEHVRKVVESNGSEVLFAKLRCSIEALEKRITHSSRQRFGKLNSMEQFRGLSEAGAFANRVIPADRLIGDNE